MLPVWGLGASLRLEGDRLWFEGDGVPMMQVLNQFDLCGVKVMVDPSLAFEPVTGCWKGAEVDRVISQITPPHSYLLEWDVVSGPLGRMVQLSSIRIFSEGRESAAKPLSSSGRVLDVVDGENGLKYVRGEILVGFKEGATEADLKALLEQLGGSLIEVIDPPGVYRIRIGEGMSVEQALKIAQALEMVEAAEPNLAFSQVDRGSVVKFSGLSGLNLNLSVAQNSGVIAVFDSGFDLSYANADYIKGTYNALDPTSAISDPSGHGTLTSLIAAGAITPLGSESTGEASAVVSVKVFDENGMTSSDTLMRALQYAADSGASIISMSWGTKVDSDFIETIMNFAVANGIKLYASSGNSQEIVYPAAYDSVIGVGGLDLNREIMTEFNTVSADMYAPAYAEKDGEIHVGTSISVQDAAHQDDVSSD